MTRPTQDQKRRAEEAIAAIAARQHAVVTRAQLLRAGMSGQTVQRWIDAKRLRVLHRGVYLVGPAPLPHTHLIAAVLACGPRSAISHISAGLLWSMAELPNGQRPVDITIQRSDRRRPGIRSHLGTIQPDEITTVEGIPVTTPARTLLDIAPLVSARELDRALAQALGSRRMGKEDLLRLLDRYRSRRGTRRLRALVESGNIALTESKAEERFLALVGKAGIPAPAVNVNVAGHRVDFFWRAERFVTEVDGFAYHASADRFEKDRRRDAELAAAGVRVMRVTWRQLVDEPEAVLVRLAVALSRASG